MQANGTHIPLNNFQGIDWLAEIVENTAFLEVNPELYGNAVFGFHNSLHVHIGLVKDPLRIHDVRNLFVKQNSLRPRYTLRTAISSIAAARSFVTSRGRNSGSSILQNPFYNRRLVCAA